MKTLAVLCAMLALGGTASLVGIGVKPALAQYDEGWRDRDYDRDWDRGRGWRWRGDWDRRRGRDCHFVTRRWVDEDGDVHVVRRRICED